MEHETYVSLETAKLLKQAGFDWELNHYYFVQNGVVELKSDFRHFAQNYNESMATMDSVSFQFDIYSAPTLEVAQKWLRDVKNYYVSVEVDCDSIGVFYTVRYIFHNGNNYNTSCIWEKDESGKDDHKRLKLFNTYEKAQEVGIKAALEIILK